MFLAIDPGVKTGWALVDAAGVLHSCGTNDDAVPSLAIRAAMIERPQVYQASKSKGDPNDLITLAIRVGRYQERLIAAGIPCGLVLPVTWKGQVPKDVQHPRVEAKLSQAEREIVYAVAKKPLAPGYDDNVWDAVALAKWGHVSGQLAKLAL